MVDATKKLKQYAVEKTHTEKIVLVLKSPYRTSKSLHLYTEKIQHRNKLEILYIFLIWGLPGSSFTDTIESGSNPDQINELLLFE